jgi:DNA-binding CsgD family transcriptional regulator
LVERGRVLFDRPDDRPRQAWFDLVEDWGLGEQDLQLPLGRLVDVVTAIRKQPPGRQVARALNTLSSRLLQDGDTERALTVAQESRVMAVELDDPALLVEATGNLALASAAAGEFEEALRLSDEEVAAAAVIGDLVLVAMALTARGVVLWESGDIPGGQVAAEQCRALLGGSRPGPSPIAWAQAQLNASEGFVDLGLWDRAIERFSELDAAVGALTPFFRGWADELRSGLAVKRGEPRAAELEVGPETNSEIRQLQKAFGVACMRDDVLTHLRRYEESRAVARSVLWQARAERGLPAYVWPLLAVVSRNEVEAALADGTPDAAIVERVAKLSASVPAQNGLHDAYAAQVAADLCWVAGEVDVELCRTAAERWEEIGLPYWHAWALLRTGQAAAGTGHPDEARSALARALDTADRLGAAPLAERIHRAAVAFSIRLVTRPGARRPDPVGLTAREHEVLALLAEGARNRGIAQRLVISEKTFSVHVSNLLAEAARRQPRRGGHRRPPARPARGSARLGLTRPLRSVSAPAEDRNFSRSASTWSSGS